MMSIIQNLKDIILDNRYKIIDKIGVGGMADVYKGQDSLLGRAVAIKILHANFANDDEFVTRFKREAQAAGKLNHPNIVNMYDVGYDQGLHYIVMEYVEGETLKEYIVRSKKLAIDEAVKIAIAIGEGLEHAHAMGIVHCDIKPHNVMITSNGRVKVADFGIARAMNATNTVMYTNSIMGSAHYLSPEQASGKPVDGNTDIYSLGVVLYEMLTGRVPFEGDTPIAVALKHVREKLTPPTRYNPSIPSMLESVVVKALSKKTEDRFGSISDMISDLRLSQGFNMGKSSRQVPYDFATQMIPTVDANPFENDIEEENSKKSGILGFIAKIPQKYIILGAAVIFVVAFLGAFLSFGNFWSNTTVEVPNVVEKVKEQRTIHLVVSKGVGDITVPDLSGMTVEQAKARLKEIGLVIGKISTGNNQDKPDAVIISQSPSGDSKVTKGTTIDITINKLVAKKVEMPNVIGMTLKDARDALNSLELSVNQIAGSVDEKSVVTEQSVKAGQKIDVGGAVNLTTTLKEEAKSKDEKSSSSNSGSNTTNGTVDVTVPSGSKEQSLRIVVQDDTGSAVIYDGTNKPGDRVVKKVSGVGNVRIQVYLNGALVQDQAL